MHFKSDLNRKIALQVVTTVTLVTGVTIVTAGVTIVTADVTIVTVRNIL